MTHELVIRDVGHKGDGTGETDDGKTLHVPLTVPGDRVAVRLKDGRASLEKILAPGPDRIGPPCPVYGSCGGCALQHWAPEAVAGWKAQQVIQALSHRGFRDPPVDACRSIPAGTRRRAALKAVRTTAKVIIGFNARGSHQVTAVDHCLLLRPELDRLITPLSHFLFPWLPVKGWAKIFLTHTATGVDCSIDASAKETRALEEAAVIFAEAHDLARLSWNGTLIAERRQPLLAWGKIKLLPPEKSFLQPSDEGEALLQTLVRDFAENPRQAADLYAGLGTFSFALAGSGAKVMAYESDAAAVTALKRAAGGTRVTAERRDLDRLPLRPDELAGFDCIVLDPPRAGARAQAEQLALAAVPRIVMVSCDPGTFARDARILVDGGYQLDQVVPVDQFTHAAHVELVALLTRTP